MPKPVETTLKWAALLACLIIPLVGAEPIDWVEGWTPGTTAHRLLFGLRVPRAIFAAVAGGCLGVLGGAYQLLFRNPLAEPYVLGTASAVTLAVVAAETWLGVAIGSLASVTAGAAGAALCFIVLLAGTWGRVGRQAERLVLFGMGLNFLLSSLLFLLLSYRFQHMGGGSLQWLFGNLPWLPMNRALVFSGLAIAMASLLVGLGPALDAMSLGESVARTLGVSPAGTRIAVIGLSSCLLALLVAHTGAIGFVGLVVPHAARLMFGAAPARVLFLRSFGIGAAFLCVADLLSRRILPPLEFPIGIITTLGGGPLFLWLLWRRR